MLTTPGRIFAGFALQYTIMPAAAFIVSRLAGLPLAFTIGCGRSHGACLVGNSTPCRALPTAPGLPTAR